MMMKPNTMTATETTPQQRSLLAAMAAVFGDGPITPNTALFRARFWPALAQAIAGGLPGFQARHGCIPQNGGAEFLKA